MDRNCDAFIRSNNTYDILIARESLEISDDRAECIQNIGEKFVAEYAGTRLKSQDIEQYADIYTAKYVVDEFIRGFGSVKENLV